MNELPDASVYRLRMKFGIGLLDHFVEMRPLYALRIRLKQLKNLEVYFSGYSVRVDGHWAKLGSSNYKTKAAAPSGAAAPNTLQKKLS